MLTWQFESARKFPRCILCMYCVWYVQLVWECRGSVGPVWGLAGWPCTHAGIRPTSSYDTRGFCLMRSRIVTIEPLPSLVHSPHIQRPTNIWCRTRSFRVATLHAHSGSCWIIHPRRRKIRSLDLGGSIIASHGVCVRTYVREIATVPTSTLRFTHNCAASSK